MPNGLKYSEREPFLDVEMSPHTARSEHPRSKGSGRRLFEVPVIIAGAAAALLLVALWTGLPAVKSVMPAMGDAVDLNYAPGPSNATLGFGAILLLSLKERTDRQDAVSLITSRSGIEITEIIDGVKGEDISKMAYPFGSPKVGNDPISSGYLGSWRTHMDALKYVVDNKIETALLFEDDVDWDMRIKKNMKALSRGLADSPLRNKSSTPVSNYHPYGMDWDIMHLGPAYVRPAKEEPYGSLHAIYEDVDRIKDAGCPAHLWMEDVYCWNPLLKRYEVPDTSRVILPSWDVSSLVAIAVTYTGAQRILYQLSYKELKTTVDWSVAGLLMDGILFGWSIVPPLFTQYKLGGDRDSDLDGNMFFGDVPSNLNGTSLGIEFSARKELTKSLAPQEGEPTRWSTEYWESLGIDVVKSPAQAIGP